MIAITERMKFIGLLLALSCNIVGFAIAQPITPDAFVADYRAAFEAKDSAKLDALTYFEGASEEDREKVRGARASTFGSGEIKSISLVPIPEDYGSVRIGRGKKFELTYAPKGMLEVKFSGNVKGLDGIQIPYAIVGGRYFIVTVKTTDLGWKGPQDQTLGLFISGAGADTATIEYSWNVSGVDQTKKSATRSVNFIGQHVNWVKVTSISPDSEITLELNRNGQATYTSPPFKGKGTLEYKKTD